MDIDVSKMFETKNKEIFKNSLVLEMERNLESLKSTTDNCVALEINKLFLFFKSYFEETNIEYTKEELLGILYKEKKTINDIVNAKIEDKKNRLKENFLSKEEDGILSKEYLEEYYQELLKETEKINEEIEVELKTEICTNFSTNIIKKYKLETVEQMDRINSRINDLFADSVISKIHEQTKFRDESLRNMSLESYSKYDNLNKTTIENNDN
ncbi:MAG: hypothetical protein IKO78_00835 [Bacilli bacterium]|nr:hypothetical protein [Bacilli bacterium]